MRHYNVIGTVPHALLVPIGVVRTEGGKHFVTVKDTKTGVMRDVEIEAGMTTLDSVEVKKGLNPGDDVVLQYRIGDSAVQYNTESPTEMPSIPGN